MPRYSFVLLFSLAAAAYGQSNFAHLHGIVRDPQGRPIAGATVTIHSQTTASERTGVTNAQGLYDAPLIPAGAYTVAAAARGFASFQEKITLEVDQNIAVDFDLQVASLAQSVSVHAGSVVMDSTQTSVSEVIEPQDIANLPLNGRMVLDLVLTVPGAHPGSGAQTGEANPLYWRPGQDSALSIGGARPNANFYLLDGAINTDPTFWTQNISLSLDAIQEFRVDTSSYTANEGGAGGGQVNIVTRSGTSTFHGAVYDYVRNRDTRDLAQAASGKGDSSSRHAEPANGPRTGSSRRPLRGE